MTPAARIQAAIEILEALKRSEAPADRFVREWFRARRYAGSKDRAAVAERVFEVLRRRAEFAWRMRSSTPRDWAIGSLAVGDGLGADAIAALFSGGTYAPAALTEDERARLTAEPFPMSPEIAGNYPAWLADELARAFGDDLAAEMAAMGVRAGVDLRANTLKAERDAVLAALVAQGFDARPAPYAPHGIRIPSGEGLAALSRTPEYEQGQFEFQDEASQMAALLAGARPGMRVLDLAAGAGGKALAMAAAMRNAGEIVADDAEPARLRQIAPRAARAGATIVHTAVPVIPGRAMRKHREGKGTQVSRPPGSPSLGASRLAGDDSRRIGESHRASASASFDIVFVDAPCSGTGTWRRQPELRWRLTPEKLRGFASTQARLLDRAAEHARPGGRVVYATCSVLPCENEDQAGAFLARHPGFEAVEAASVWREAADTAPPPGMGLYLRASPRRTGTDGFFAAIFRRNS